jgi:hypothetical protein
MRFNRQIAGTRRSSAGWSSAEYLAILLGLMAVWRGAQAVLDLAKVHHDKFAWALTLPF